MHQNCAPIWRPHTKFKFIGVQAGGARGRGGEGARGAAVPPNFGQLIFFGQQEKIWAKPAFKDVFMFFIGILKRYIFSILT